MGIVIGLLGVSEWGHSELFRSPGHQLAQGNQNVPLILPQIAQFPYASQRTI